MKLIGNRVLVQPEMDKKWRGMHIPEDITHFENPFMDARIGVVLSVGVGRRTKKGVRVPITNVKVGDRVLLPRSDKVHVQFNDAFCWLCDADTILGILE